MRRLTIALFVIALAPVVMDAESLTVERAVEIALVNNLSLKVERIELDTKERAERTKWNAFVPTVGAGGTLSRSNTEPTDPIVFGPLALPGSNRWDLSWSVSAQLPFSAALFHGLNQTKIDLIGGQISLETAQKRLIRDIRKGFYNLILLRENIVLMEQNIATAERRYEQARANYQSGLVSEYTLLSAQVAMENLKPAREDMRVAHELALQSFKMSLGLDRNEEIDIQGDIRIEPVQLDTDTLIQAYVSGRLDVMGVKSAIESLKNVRKTTLAYEMTPSLMLKWLMDPAFANEALDGGWFGDVDTDWNQRGGSLELTLTVPLDAFLPASKSRVKLADLDDQIRQTQLNLAITVQRAELEIDSLVRTLNKSLASIETLKLNVELAERAYRLAEEAYNLGTRDLLEVQNAELELRKAQLEVLGGEYNYITGLLDLEYALNTSIGETK